MTGSGAYSCGACKFLRRKCTSTCIFSPYFCYAEGAGHFAAVHRVFGASNASKILTSIPLQYRSEAVISICYEALTRMQDPVYGCVAEIFALEQQVANLQEEIDQLVNYMFYDSFSEESLQEMINMNAGLPNDLVVDNMNHVDDYINYQQMTPTWFASPAQGSCLLENDRNMLNTLSYQSF